MTRSLLETAVLFGRAEMLEALADAASVVARKSPKPILANFKLDAGPDGATISATDLEVGIVRRVLGVKADSPVSLVLPPERFGAILRGAEDDEVALEVGDDRATLRGRRWHFTLPTEDPALFPAVPGFEAADYHAVAPADLRRLIRRTSYATDDQSTRYAIGGVLVAAEADSLTMVGTDGRRIAIQAVAAEVEGKGFGGSAAVLPLKALKLIERTLDDEDPPAHVATGQSAATVRTGRATIWTRLVEGRFPRYQDAVPGRFETAVTVEAGVLLDATGQAMIVTSEESRGVDFSFGGDTLKLSSQAADVGSGDVEIAIVTLSGPPLEITLDPRYLLDALRALDRSAVARLEMNGHKDAIVLRAEDRFVYTMAPLTRDR